LKFVKNKEITMNQVIDDLKFIVESKKLNEKMAYMSNITSIVDKFKAENVFYDIKLIVKLVHLIRIFDNYSVGRERTNLRINVAEMLKKYENIISESTQKKLNSIDYWCFVNYQLGGVYPNFLINVAFDVRYYSNNIIEARALLEKALAIIEKMDFKILENGEKIYSFDKFIIMESLIFYLVESEDEATLLDVEKKLHQLTNEKFFLDDGRIVCPAVDLADFNLSILAELYYRLSLCAPDKKKIFLEKALNYICEAIKTEKITEHSVFEPFLLKELARIVSSINEECVDKLKENFAEDHEMLDGLKNCKNTFDCAVFFYKLSFNKYEQVENNLPYLVYYQMKLVELFLKNKYLKEAVSLLDKNIVIQREKLGREDTHEDLKKAIEWRNLINIEILKLKENKTINE
jgi:hypothetical protein